MMTSEKFSSMISLSNSRRVVLDDETLTALVSTPEFVSAGGDGSVNNSCTNNGDCGGSINTAQCTNAIACDGSLNSPHQCKMPPNVPGG